MWTFAYPDVRQIGEYARRAEEAGWDGISVGDVQSASGDMYVAMTLAAMATERIKIGSDVTNPLTRHPVITAGAIASVQRVSDGRAVLGIGRGDSWRMLVMRRSTRSFSRAILRLYRLTSAETAYPSTSSPVGRGMAPHVDTLKLAEAPEDSRLTWLGPEDKKVPVAVSASGPRVIGAAARHADIVMLGVGADLGRLGWGLEQVRNARREAGLDPEGIRCGAYLSVACHPDVEVARGLTPELDTFVRFSNMHGKTNGPVTQQDQEVLTAVHRNYDVRDHSSSAVLPAEFVDRYAIVGPPDECSTADSPSCRYGI